MLEARVSVDGRGLRSRAGPLDGPRHLAKTTDGGRTWDELPLPALATDAAGYPAIGIGFISDDIGWVAPEDAALPVFRSFDGGESWEEDPTLVDPINRFRFTDATDTSAARVGYAIGADVWKLELPPLP